MGMSQNLVHLLLLVDAELAGAAVDEEEEAADDGEDLEEVVLGKVFVGVVLVELQETSLANHVTDKHAENPTPGVGGMNIPSRSC